MVDGEGELKQLKQRIKSRKERGGRTMVWGGYRKGETDERGEDIFVEIR